MNRHEEYQDCKTKYPEHKKIYPEYRTQDKQKNKTNEEERHKPN